MPSFRIQIGQDQPKIERYSIKRKKRHTKGEKRFKQKRNPTNSRINFVNFVIKHGFPDFLLHRRKNIVELHIL